MRRQCLVTNILFYVWSAGVISSGEETSLIIDGYTPEGTLESGDTVQLGTTVILVCRVTGIPYGVQTSYKWTCPKTSCNIGEGENPNIKVVKNTLHLNPLEHSDTGWYTCEATSNKHSLGQGKASFYIQTSSNIPILKSYLFKSISITPMSYTMPIASYIMPVASYTMHTVKNLTDQMTYSLGNKNGKGILYSDNNLILPESLISNITQLLGQSAKVPVITCDTTVEGYKPKLYMYNHDRTTQTVGRRYLRVARYSTRVAGNGQYYCWNGKDSIIKFNMYLKHIKMYEPFTPEVEVSLSPNQIMIFLTYYTIYEDDYVNEFIIEYIRMDLNFTVKWRTVSAKSNKAQVMEKIVDFAAGVQYKLRVWSTQSQQVCARAAVTVFTTGSAVPSNPRPPAVSRVFQDGVELNWIPPREPNGQIKYLVWYKVLRDTSWIQVDTRSNETYLNITGLHINNHYCFQVIAVGAMGRTLSSVTTYRHRPQSDALLRPVTKDLPNVSITMTPRPNKDIANEPRPVNQTIHPKPFWNFGMIQRRDNNSLVLLYYMITIISLILVVTGASLVLSTRLKRD